MGFSIKRFIKNPKQSIEKTYSIISTFFFKRSINRSLSENMNTDQDDIHLESIYTDNRDAHDSVIDKIRCVATYILSMIDHLSDEYNFNYFLAYGTLIGAIRHQDFIPWDDDIDIMMTMEDLNILLSVAHLLPDSLEIKVMDNNFIKIMDKNSKISLDGKRGVAVDIFVLDVREGSYRFKNVHNHQWISSQSKEWLPAIKHPFGNNHFSIPSNYEDILTKIYGDYMRLPPQEERVYPHIDVDRIKI